MLNKFYITLISLLFICTPYLAQNDLKFIARDSTTSEKLVGVIIQLDHTSFNTTTNINGIAELKNIPDGEHLITASLMGYKNTSKKIKLPPDQPGEIVLIMLIPDSKTFDEVTVSSTRTNSRIDDLPMKVEVLGEEDMNEENSIKPGNVASILGDLSVIHIQQTSAVTGNSSVRMQGLDGKYTQLLRDGLPLYEGFSGSFGVIQLLPMDLKQVEIIKGSVSTLYGGGAIGGMINFISKEPVDSPEVSFTLNQSTLKESNVNGYYARKFKKMGVTLFAGGMLQKAVDVNGDGFSDLPETMNILVHPRLFFYFNPKTTLKAGLSTLFENRTGGDMKRITGQPDSIHSFFEKNITRRSSMDFHFNRDINDNQSFIIKGTTSLFSRNVDQSGLAFAGHQFVSYAEAGHILKAKKHQLVTGLNNTTEQFTKSRSDSSRINNYFNQTLGLFIQDGWQLKEKLLIETGIRLDRHNKYGSFVLPRIAFFYKPTPTVSFRLSGGTGYKAPNIFTQQTLSGSFKTLLPPDNAIQAERSMGVNFDINYHTVLFDVVSMQIDQAFYYTQITDPIALKYDSAGSVKPANAKYNVTSTGTDTYLRFTFEEIELYLGYNHTIAKQSGSSSEFIYFSPQDKFATTLTYEIEGKWRFGVESSWVGNQYTGRNIKAKNYWFVAAMIERKLKKGSIVLNCENVLDFRQTQYENIVIPPASNPSFKALWGPIDGRVINLSWRIKL
ncbi:MAG: TonB-dependent receptor [Bacteroidia bacterium]|nr:TonB-dependent receptor [Bacteroidia bacterium]